MQAAARGLYVILQHLAALISLVFIFHRLGPDPPGNTADDTVLRIHAIAEEKRKVGRKIIDLHPTAEIIFHVRKTIGQREGQLADRVGPCLCNMIPAYRYTIKIAHLVLYKILLYIAHKF